MARKKTPTPANGEAEHAPDGGADAAPPETQPESPPAVERVETKSETPAAGEGEGTARDKGYVASRNPNPRDPLRRTDGREFAERWSGIIEGVVNVDADRVYERVRNYIDTKCELTVSTVGRAIERGAHYYAEACTLAAKAESDCAALRIVHAEWLEPLKTSARMALEKEKAAEGWKKAITIDMVMDQVRHTWPDEVAAREERLRGLEAAKHAIQNLPDAVKLRVQSFQKMVDVAIQTGRHEGTLDHEQPRRSRDDRSRDDRDDRDRNDSRKRESTGR